MLHTVTLCTRGEREIPNSVRQSCRGAGIGSSCTVPAMIGTSCAELILLGPRFMPSALWT